MSSLNLRGSVLTPHFPLIAGGITAQLFTASPPNGLESHLDTGDHAVSFTCARLGLVLRREQTTELVDSLMPSCIKALPRSFGGMTEAPGDRVSAGWDLRVAQWGSPSPLERFPLTRNGIKR